MRHIRLILFNKSPSTHTLLTAALLSWLITMRYGNESHWFSSKFKRMLRWIWKKNPPRVGVVMLYSPLPNYTSKKSGCAPKKSDYTSQKSLRTPEKSPLRLTGKSSKTRRKSTKRPRKTKNMRSKQTIPLLEMRPEEIEEAFNVLERELKQRLRRGYWQLYHICTTIVPRWQKERYNDGNDKSNEPIKCFRESDWDKGLQWTWG